MDRRADIEPLYKVLADGVEDDLPNVTDREAWADRAQESIETIGGTGLVMSDEGLSWLHHDEEIRRVLDLLEEWRVTIVCYLRHPHALQASYRWATSSMKAWQPEPTSVYYSEPDSWIYDYEYRMDRWRHHLGRKNVVTMSYTACMERDGTIISSFLDLLGVDPPPSDEIAEYQLNQSR